jgi:hypothetical protein
MPVSIRLTVYHLFIRFSPRFVSYWRLIRDLQIGNESQKILLDSKISFLDRLNHKLYSEFISASTANSELHEFKEPQRTHPSDNLDGVK